MVRTHVWELVFVDIVMLGGTDQGPQVSIRVVITCVAIAAIE